MTIKPRRPVPDLSFPLLNGGTYRLSEDKPDNFVLVVVYRGLHCPLCKRYLGELNAMLPEFASAGVSVVAVSMDNEERARQSAAEWDVAGLKIGYGLKAETAREWGLYLSTPVREGEPSLFAEPGLFLVKPDGTLFAANIGTTPWSRPPLDAVLRGIKAAIERGTPGRGEA